MIRVADWQTRLERFLAGHREHEFRYGSWDCALFVCDAIKLMTGVDPAAGFRGNYSSRTEALVAIRAYSGKRSLLALTERITSEMKMREVPALLAGRGDVVLIRRAKADVSLGLIALNGRSILTVSRGGLCAVPLSLALRAWRV